MREVSFYMGVVLFALVGLAYWWGIKCESAGAGDAIQRAAGILPHALPNSINFNWTHPRTGYPAGTLAASPAPTLPTNAAT